jgi:zinc/manganese transport system substrate-binding protein
MMNSKNITLALAVLFINLHAQVNVVTTTTVIYDIVKQIGGDQILVDHICRGDQDPHFLEVLPSYMLKIRKADVMFQNGLGLERWAQKLIDGSRNSDLQLVDLSKNIPVKGKPTGKIDASRGDIHPFGNPHYWLDPENIKIMASEILDVLIAQDFEHQFFFQSNYDRFISNLEKKIQQWDEQLAIARGQRFIVYHDSWMYFADRYGIQVSGFIEPKPGIPPTPSHNAELIRLISNSNIRLILMENYYSISSPNQISEATGIKVVNVPIYVFGMEGIDTYIELMDYIVLKISEILLNEKK